jgi:hypothetical protein
LTCRTGTSDNRRNDSLKKENRVPDRCVVSIRYATSMTIERAPYHVGVATPDIAASMRGLGDLFGYTWTPVRSGRDFQLSSPDGDVDDTASRSFSCQGAPRLELLEGSPGSVWQPERGLHVHHTAYWTDDFTADCLGLVAKGWTLERTTFDRTGQPVTFCYLVKDGQRIELVDVERRPDHLALFDTP